MIDAASFISSRMMMKSKAALISIALSFFVIILALSIASGYRYEVRKSLSEISGDIIVTPLSSHGAAFTNENASAFVCPAELIENMVGVRGVASVIPVIYGSGVAKNGDDIHGVVFKGVNSPDSLSATVSVPRKLASLLTLDVGDSMLSYFISESVTVRKFTVGEIYDGIVTDDDKLVVMCNADVLRRVNGMSENAVSALEIRLDDAFQTDAASSEVKDEIACLLSGENRDNVPSLLCSRIRDAYPQLFDWLDLIDNNVTFILLLMIIVAGFNMISGLLIMLFERISTIGLLKSMGMTDGAISSLFLRSAARLVAVGMLAGNVSALLLCAVQQYFKPLNMNPDNYFVSFLPVRIDFAEVLACDVVAFAAIMLILLIPCTFISKVDPSRTIAVR